MQENTQQKNIIINLDHALKNVLETLEMGFYNYHFDYYLLDNKKVTGFNDKFQSYTYKGKKFNKAANFFKLLSNHYHPVIKVEKESRNIFIELYKQANEEEKKYLINHYDYFITFDQTFNYLEKNEGKEKALHFVTHNELKGRLREVDKEEKLLLKIYHLEPENFYENLLSYLSNHASIYNNSIHSIKYQGMLKNLINEYLSDKRKNFAVFTGDSQKKYLNDSSMLYEDEKINCEIIIKLNKTFMEEHFIPDSIKEKHEIGSTQGIILESIDELIKVSKRLNVKAVHRIYTEDKEILTFYITKEKNDINKEDIIKYLQAALNYWKDNVIELKEMKKEEMIQSISQKAEINALYKELENKYQPKGYTEKKVKL